MLCLLDGLQKTEIQPIVIMPEGDGGLEKELKDRDISSIRCDVPVQFATTNKRPPFYKPIQRRRWTASRVSEIHQRTRAACDILVKQLTEIDAIYSNTSATLLGHFLAKALHRPHIWHLREFAENYGMHPVGGPTMFREQLMAADERITISRAVASKLLGRFSSCCCQIYNGVGSEADFAKLAMARQERQRSPACRFLLMGQILQSKGHAEAIVAIKHLSNLVRERILLRIVGSGDSDWLSSLVHRNRAEELVQVIGPTKDPFSEILSADALLMCSPMEAMGRVTAEAMVSGCPVIGFDAFGTSELIDHGRTGLLYRTQSQLVQRMQQLIRDPALGPRLAANAYQEAVNKFSNETYASRVADVIRKAVNG
ncbi:MAG: glycosyltransferase family 4 protein [Planctomycetaceae bacterium]